jgi:hypothetical protein
MTNWHLGTWKMDLRFFLFSRNPSNSTPIVFGDVASSNNVARLCGISNASGNQ